MRAAAASQLRNDAGGEVPCGWFGPWGAAEVTTGDPTVSKDDKLEQRYEKKQERKRRRETVVSDDDAPIPDAPVEQASSGSTP